MSFVRHCQLILSETLLCTHGIHYQLCDITIVIFITIQIFRLSAHVSTYMSPALRTRPQDSSFSWYNNSSPPECQRILFDNHCHISGKIIIILHISLVLGEYSRCFACQFGVISLSVKYLHEDTDDGEHIMFVPMVITVSRPSYLSRHVKEAYGDRPKLTGKWLHKNK